MGETILKVESLSKQYRLGVVGGDTIREDLKRFWYKMRGKEDPFLMVGETNDRSESGLSDYVLALKNINFEINKGEVLGIIGAGMIFFLRDKMLTPFLIHMGPFEAVFWGGATYLGTFAAGYLLGKKFDNT